MLLKRTPVNILLAELSALAAVLESKIEAQICVQFRVDTLSTPMPLLSSKLKSLPFILKCRSRNSYKRGAPTSRVEHAKPWKCCALELSHFTFVAVETETSCRRDAARVFLSM